MRRLAERMDQTGKQLDGLTDLYRSEARHQPQPDLEKLASLVAERTSREMLRLRGDEMGIDAGGLDALEKRLSKLFADTRTSETPGLLNDVAAGLTRVDERLDRLEDAARSFEPPVASSAVAPPPAPVAARPAAPKPPQRERRAGRALHGAARSFSEPPPAPRRAPRAPGGRHAAPAPFRAAAR